MHWKYPYKYSIVNRFMHVNYLQRYYDAYPEQQIREHCANPQASEHESSLWGNYSAPVLEKDFLSFVEHEMLDDLKQEFLGNKQYAHDHHYVNFHMDEPGSHLEPHNDLKNFRWLITSQVYLDNNNQGVRILDRDLSEYKTVPEKPNTAYFICASPFSWHDVPELTKLKRSILFRVGKRKHKTLAHPMPDKPAWVIVNDGHDDTHYAKLGLRMGNLTEAWLYGQDCYNIYHTDWRAKQSDKVINYAKEIHDEVNVVFSGEFKNLGNYFITKDNFEYTADVVFGKREDIILTEVERCMYDYYQQDLHMNYVDINL